MGERGSRSKPRHRPMLADADADAIDTDNPGDDGELRHRVLTHELISV